MCDINCYAVRIKIILHPLVEIQCLNLLFFRLFSNLIRIRVKKKKLVFFSSTLFNVEVEGEKGIYYNSMDGYYYDLFPEDSLLIEDADEEFKWRAKILISQCHL